MKETIIKYANKCIDYVIDYPEKGLNFLRYFAIGVTLIYYFRFLDMLPNTRVMVLSSPNTIDMQEGMTWLIHAWKASAAGKYECIEFISALYLPASLSLFLGHKIYTKSASVFNAVSAAIGTLLTANALLAALFCYIDRGSMFQLFYSTYFLNNLLNILSCAGILMYIIAAEQIMFSPVTVDRQSVIMLAEQKAGRKSTI